MPSKKRPKGPPHRGVGRPRRPKFREAEVQTDAELGALLDSVSALSSSEAAAGNRSISDPAVLVRRQNILMIQLRKISKQNKEMRETIAKYEQIPNLLQAIKAQYESTLNSIKDDMVTLVFEQRNRENKLMEHLRKQKCLAERVIGIKDERLKARGEKNKALKVEKKLLNEHLQLLQEAWELEQRRVQVAVKVQWNALDEAQEIQKKMEDKLFLGASAIRRFWAQYESTLNSIKDDMVTLVFEQRNRENKLMEHLRQQKCLAERVIGIKDERLKARGEKNKALKVEKKLLNEHLQLLQEAWELEQRRVQVAVKVQWNALDEAQEIQKKMEDKLFLAANQRCGTCQTRERVQDELTDQIADKHRQIEELRLQLKLKDDAIAEQIRINQILTNNLKNLRGELQDKRFADKSYRAELDKRQTQLKQAQTELRQLRAVAASCASSTVAASCSIGGRDHDQFQQQNPNILTPPDEEITVGHGHCASLIPCANGPSTATKERVDQQPFVMKRAPNLENNNCDKGGDGDTVLQQKTNAKRSSEDVTSGTVKRPRIVAGGDDTNFLNNGKGGSVEEVCEISFNSEGTTNGSNDIIVEETTTGASRCGVGQQQQVKRTLQKQQPDHIRAYLNSPMPIVGRQFMPSTITAAAESPTGAARSWRRHVDDQPITQLRKPFLPKMHHHQQQFHQQQHSTPVEIIMGTAGATAATTTSHPSFFFSSNNNIPNNMGSSSLSFRKCAGATTDDFCNGPKAAYPSTESMLRKDNNTNRTPVDGVGDSDAAMSSTWRKNGHDKFFFMNCPVNAQRDVELEQLRLRDRIEQEILVSLAGRPSFVSASAAVPPPMYAARQQQNFPPPRPTAPIPRPFVAAPQRQQPTSQNNNSRCLSQTGGGGMLPWHEQSSGPFPCTAVQRPRHYPTAAQFFNR
uniref:Coiled-coil domain-containing protein 96 n=1 Tax=Globodera pallida TaxID=36090 RepID=A0A183BLI3_GLOPA